MHKQTVHMVHIMMQFVHAILVYLLDDIGLLLTGETEVVHTTSGLEVSVQARQNRLIVTGERGLWNQRERLGDRLLFDGQLLVSFLLLLDDLLDVVVGCFRKYREKILG